jgi:hypothetical protein
MALMGYFILRSLRAFHFPPSGVKSLRRRPSWIWFNLKLNLYSITDATLVESYATDFCGVKTLRDAIREQVENFVAQMADWAVPRTAQSLMDEILRLESSMLHRSRYWLRRAGSQIEADPVHSQSR